MSGGGGRASDRWKLHVSACPSEEADELPFVEDADTLVPRLVQLAPRVLARHHVVRVLAHGFAGARAERFDEGLGFLTGEPLQAAGRSEEHTSELQSRENLV